MYQNFDEIDLWTRVINDSRWHDGSPDSLLKLIEHFKNLGLQIHDEHVNKSV